MNSSPDTPLTIPPPTTAPNSGLISGGHGPLGAIYLDHAASSTLRDCARDAMISAWQKGPGNPASTHFAGRAQRRFLEDAREKIAFLLGAFPDEVLFTSGATEANNLALFGHAKALGQPASLVSSLVEHASVLQGLQSLEKSGHHLRLVKPDGEGIVSGLAQEVLSKALDQKTGLVSPQLANQETGAIQPVAELGEQLTRLIPGWRIHTDATQAVGKFRVDFHRLSVQSLAFSAHKFGGPVGVGALLVRRGVKLRPLFYGGGQQEGNRPGTESAALATGMAAALAEAIADMTDFQTRTKLIRGRLLDLLREQGVPFLVNGPGNENGMESRKEQRDGIGMPHILNLSFPGIRADLLLMALDLEKVAVSAGSACSSGSILPSGVLTSMGLPEERVRSAIRISFGHDTTIQAIDQAFQRLLKVVRRLAPESGE